MNNWSTLIPVLDSDATTEKARRWSAFVCPDCRLVFRVPRDHDGEGIICASCRRMLRIPQGGDAVAPLMAPLQKIEFADDGIDSPNAKKTRSKRKKKPKEAELHDWDASAGKWKSNRSRKKQIVKKLLGVAVLLLISVGSILFFLKPPKHVEGDGDSTAFSMSDEDLEGSGGSRLLLFGEELEDQVDLPKIMKLSGSEFFDEAELLAEKFLNAKSVDEILPLIRNSKTIEAKIKSYYPDGKIPVTGLSKFNSSGHPIYKDQFVAVEFLTPNYETKQLAFMSGENGLNIDWESWVGWSEMPWNELLEQRPSRSVLVRAMVKCVNYYNFDYSDESEWRSYRLTSPDGETILDGYIPRNSLLDQRLRPSEKDASIAVILKIHFPKGERASSPQVLIDELVADGWVMPE